MFWDAPQGVGWGLKTSRSYIYTAMINTRYKTGLFSILQLLHGFHNMASFVHVGSSQGVYLLERCSDEPPMYWEILRRRVLHHNIFYFVWRTLQAVICKRLDFTSEKATFKKLDIYSCSLMLLKYMEIYLIFAGKFWWLKYKLKGYNNYFK